MSTEIKIKRGSGETPALKDGELGFNKDTKILSIGTNGTAAGNIDIGRPIEPISQSSYDKLTTKDPNTIYIIESDDTVVTQSAMEAYAAPSGYGLGTRAVQASNYDANNAVRNGWYFAGINVPTVGYWLIRVDSYDGIVYCKQTAYAIVTASNTDSMCVCRRYQENGVWSEWEWENPPMILGVEYRLTERYLGKPVYVKLLDCGALPNATAKTINHNISNLSYVLALSASTPYFYKGSFIPSSNGNLENSFNMGIGVDSICIITNADRSQFGGCVAFIKYTKSTD